MFRKLLGGIVGFVAAFSVIALVQSVGHMIFPTPADLDPTDAEAFAEYVAALPFGAFLPVLLSYLLGTAAGVFAGGWIAGGGGMGFAIVIGGLVLVLTIVNLVMIPHPLWFSVVAVIGIPAAAYAAGRFTPTRKYD